ncbi:SDR family NAD(P)-dependent oxidoreductase [Oceanobacillus halophilus]|uniref:SDR family oxidoreductase n=1 Tax=Oceanobacillus halophilus TaxID=930130 RepID=A0A494ZTB2_9BACI|nr:SDR family oxidoreductase [Oceanobacillus halophilus]RKQ29354.1 SDR family oxidoreductase [Oceanobacillus halophilus]
MGRLSGKVAIVTGGGSGIGAETAKLFAEEDAKVILADLREEGVKQVKAEIEANNGVAEYVVGNISNEEDSKKITDAAVEAFGKLDILINNAGYAGSSDPADQYNSDEFDKIYKVNAYGTFYMVKSAVTHMKENGGGSIVNVSSNSTVMPSDYPGYASSKGAVKTMSYTFAGILAPDRIRVNTLIPGTTKTPMVQAIMDDPALMKKYGDTVPLGSLMEPKDLAYGALYLASDEAKMVTGTELVIDGGLSL